MQHTTAFLDAEHMTPAEIFDHYEQCRLRMLSKVPDSMLKPFKDAAAKRVKVTETAKGAIEVVVTHRYGEEPCPNV